MQALSETALNYKMQILYPLILMNGSSPKMPGTFEQQSFEPCDSEPKLRGSKPCRSKNYHDFFERALNYPLIAAFPDSHRELFGGRGLRLSHK